MVIKMPRKNDSGSWSFTFGEYMNEFKDEPWLLADFNKKGFNWDKEDLQKNTDLLLIQDQVENKCCYDCYEKAYPPAPLEVIGYDSNGELIDA